MKKTNKRAVEEESQEVNSNSYHVVLSNYEGPIDLLLDLVKRAKISIEDIFISSITEQYLEAMKQVDELDMDQAADFIEVAATLLEIKSRALLPRPETEEEAVAEDSPEKELQDRIRERYYVLYKDAAEKMRERELINMHYRAPDESVGQPRLVLKDMSMGGLANALYKLLGRQELNQKTQVVRKIARDPFTVEGQKSVIRSRVCRTGECSFFDLFDEDYDRSEVVTTFSALLELVKSQEFTVKQENIFEEITIAVRSAEDNGN